MARNNNNLKDFFKIKFLGIKSVFQIASTKKKKKKKTEEESIEMQMLKMTKSTPSIHVFIHKKKILYFH